MAQPTSLAPSGAPRHPVVSRRIALQAGALGLCGLGLDQLQTLRALAADAPRPRAKAVIYIFLSGGLSQLDSFDLKPDAPDGIRGEFQAIETKTPGIQICEHLPLLAQRSGMWALVRSLGHPSNDHSAAHLIMLSGRSILPGGFDPGAPGPNDWPSIAAAAAGLCPPRNNLPPAVVLPEKLVHNTGRVIPGQLGGLIGRRHDPWFLEVSAFDPTAYGAFPTFEFDHQERARTPKRMAFQAPELTLPEGFGVKRLAGRVQLLQHIDAQRKLLDSSAQAGQLDANRQQAISLLTNPRVRAGFDLAAVEPAVLERYGRNSFGWSLLMARRMVEAGVALVQVNLGNNETWDTHGNAFPHLARNLFPPTDRALSALLDDLHSSGLLDSTLIVMAGEFGRTPKISTLTQYYKGPGRDHWGRVQTVFLAGGGVRGGCVVGSSDKIGGHPATDPQTPENIAATIYHALGIPRETTWHDTLDRAHQFYLGEPIAGLR
jgi:hypothetical protein